MKALIGGTLIDGFGGKPLHNSVVLLRGERIEKIGTVETLPVPAAYDRISTEGMTVMPGIWDMHVHLLYGGYPNGGEWQRTFHAQYGQIMPATANQLLMSGVTTARDMGAPLTMILEMKKRIASGAITGPTLYAAGPQVAHDSPEGQTFRLAVSGVDDAHAKIKQLAAAGVDLIKVTDQETLSAEEMSAIMDSWVHDLGMDPLLVIRRATLASAIFMGADKDSGSISEGKFADIVAVQGDPLRNMDILRNPAIVTKHGRRYK